MATKLLIVDDHRLIGERERGLGSCARSNRSEGSTPGGVDHRVSRESKPLSRFTAVRRDADHPISIREKLVTLDVVEDPCAASDRPAKQFDLEALGLLKQRVEPKRGTL